MSSSYRKTKRAKAQNLTTKRLFAQYLTTLAVLILAIVFGTFGLALVLNYLNLSHISLINALLLGFESGYIVLFYFLAAITAAIFLAYRYISRSTKQLDEVIKASASLAYPDEDPLSFHQLSKTFKMS